MRTPEETLRQPQPTDGIETALAAFRYPARPPRRWPAAAGLATALAVGVVALRLSAPAAEAASLAQVAAALESAPTVARSSETFYRGKWHKSDDLMFQEGVKRRYQWSGSSDHAMARAFDGHRVWEIQYAQRFARISTEPPSGFGGRYDDVKALLGGSGGSWRIVGTRKAGGTLVHDLATRPQRGVAEAHSILRTEHDGRPLDWTFSKNGKRFAPDFRILWRYPNALPPDTFAFRPPPGFDVYDADAIRARARRALAEGPVQERDGAKARLVAAHYRRATGLMPAELRFVVESEHPLPTSSGLLIDADGREIRLAWLNPLRVPTGVAAIDANRQPRQRPKAYRKTFRLNASGTLEGRSVVVYEAGDMEMDLANFRPPYRLIVPAVAPGPERPYKPYPLNPGHTELSTGIDRGTFEFSNVVPEPAYGDELRIKPPFETNMNDMHGLRRPK